MEKLIILRLRVYMLKNLYILNEISRNYKVIILSTIEKLSDRKDYILLL